jgi:hypothetical protein
MKKIVVSVGLVALGASSLIPQQAIAVDAAKPWSASVTLRGFYDDNVNSTHNSADGIDGTFGWEVSPSVGVHWGNDQTTFLASYLYSFKYYDDRIRPINKANNLIPEKYDQSHTVSLELDHSFTERYEIKVRDSFVIGQEPDALRSGNTFNTFQRVPGNNIRNSASIIFNAQITPLFGLELGYDNGWTDYADSGATVDIFGDISPSRSGELDRIDQGVHLDGRWNATAQTVGVLGYKYQQVDYIGDELIAGNVNAVSKSDPFFPKMSDFRNSRSQIVYIGADHSFRPDFTASARIGGQYTDHYNDFTSSPEFTPYVQASLSYSYAPEDYLTLGLTHSRSATDVASISAGSGKITQDTDSSVLYGSLHHRIVRHLYGNVISTFQNNIFNGGPNDGQSEQFFLLGVDLEYQFNPHLSTHIGYNYDRLESEIANRSFDRNRVYLGVTASY